MLDQRYDPLQTSKYPLVIEIMFFVSIVILIVLGLIKEKPVSKPTPQATTYEKICMGGTEVLKITNSKQLHFVSTGKTCLEEN